MRIREFEVLFLLGFYLGVGFSFFKLIFKVYLEVMVMC